jgi:UDP-3-O-[3-hydroxymyristoyl] glucosamine N-acyltransferase
LKLREIADRLQCRLEGDGEVDIVRVAGIQQARAGDLTFVANAKYVDQLASTRASAVILANRTKASAPAQCAVLRSDDPYSAFARALALFPRETPQPKGIDPLSSIARDAVIGADVSIGSFVSVGARASIGARTIIYPNAVIGPGARVGDDCVVHSQVSIREDVVIGNRVTLLDGVVIGADGFGFARQSDGTHLKIPQHATVVIEDDVEIGANSTVDRPAVGETRIGAGTKIDNLVHVAHGVALGKRVLLAAQVGIAGSSVLEDDVVMGGQAGSSNHIRIGARSQIGGKSAVFQSVEPGSFAIGYPAIDHKAWKKAVVVFRDLPALKKRLEALERRLAALQDKPGPLGR